MSAPTRYIPGPPALREARLKALRDILAEIGARQKGRAA